MSTQRMKKFHWFWPWQYFRRALDTGDGPPAVLDNKMSVQKNRRLLAYLVKFLPIWFIQLNRTTQTSSGLIQGLTFALMARFFYRNKGYATYTPA